MAEAYRAPARARRAAAVAAIVLAVAAGAGALAVAGRHDAPQVLAPATAPVTGPVVACPERLAVDPHPAVPALPAGVDVAGRLLPPDVPVALDVCGYEDGTGRLLGSRHVTAGLGTVPDDLAVPPGPPSGPCAGRAAGPYGPYAAAFSYPGGGRVWLAVLTDANGCTSVTNGATTSPTYVADLVATASGTGAWPGLGPSRGPCDGGPSERLGQERRLVPDGWSSVLFCARDRAAEVGRPAAGAAPAYAARVLGAAVARAVVDLLDRAPRVRDGRTSCPLRPDEQPSPRLDGFLVVRYPTGRPVVVSPGSGCDARLGNGSLRVLPPPADRARLLELLPPA